MEGVHARHSVRGAAAGRQRIAAWFWAGRRAATQKGVRKRASGAPAAGRRRRQALIKHARVSYGERGWHAGSSKARAGQGALPPRPGLPWPRQDIAPDATPDANTGPGGEPPPRRSPGPGGRGSCGRISWTCTPRARCPPPPWGGTCARQVRRQQRVASATTGERPAPPRTRARAVLPHS